MVYLELFLGFLKVGLFSFGGAYAAIPLIREVVLSYGWMDEEMLTYIQMAAARNRKEFCQSLNDALNNCTENTHYVTS